MLKMFAENTHFTIDAAERSHNFDALINILKLNFRLIATLKERLSMTHQEDTLPEILLLTCEERSRVQGGRGSHISQATLENILPP